VPRKAATSNYLPVVTGITELQRRYGSLPTTDPRPLGTKKGGGPSEDYLYANGITDETLRRLCLGHPERFGDCGFLDTFQWVRSKFLELVNGRTKWGHATGKPSAKRDFPHYFKIGANTYRKTLEEYKNCRIQSLREFVPLLHELHMAFRDLSHARYAVCSLNFQDCPACMLVRPLFLHSKMLASKFHWNILRNHSSRTQTLSLYSISERSWPEMPPPERKMAREYIDSARFVWAAMQPDVDGIDDRSPQVGQQVDAAIAAAREEAGIIALASAKPERASGTVNAASDATIIEQDTASQDVADTDAAVKAVVESDTAPPPGKKRGRPTKVPGGVTQQEAATVLKVAKRTIQNWDQNRNPPPGWRPKVTRENSIEWARFITDYQNKERVKGAASGILDEPGMRERTKRRGKSQGDTQ